MELTVRGAKTERDAKLAAHAVRHVAARQDRLHGGDPNWAACCRPRRSGAPFNVKRVSLFSQGSTRD